MVVKEEFKVKDASGHTVILQNLTTGISYLDFGMTHLPRDFQGYRVKYTDRIAQPPVSYTHLTLPTTPYV